MVAIAVVVSNVEFLQRYLWNNAGFGRVRKIPDLGKVPWRFQPTVIPLAENASASAILEAEPKLFETQPQDRAGRFYSAADYYQLYNGARKPPSKYELAWLATNVDDVVAAAVASTERWAAGKPLGLLDGVPIGVKCDIELKGYVNTFGMRPNKAYPCFTRPAEETTWPVLKLQEAGAIVVGQHNMHEVGMDTTGCNPATGTPINWYNKSYYPGGSSSGAGSSLGAGLVPIAVGTDAGGSIRVPPANNGVYGLKPSHDRTVVMNSTVCVTGPMAATVADLTVAYRIMSQPDPRDPVQGKFAVSTPPASSAKKVVAVPREWVNRSAPAVLEHFQRVLDHLSGTLGYEVVDIGLPYLREGQIAHAAVCLTEGFDDARGRVPNSPDSWAALLNHPNRILLAAGQHTPAADYIKYGQVRELLMQHLAFLFERYPGLLILTPTTPTVGWKIHPGDQKYGFSDGNLSILNMLYVWLANMTGCPSVTCPMGYADPEQGEGKVPLGVLAMAEWGAEEQLLDWAGDVERYLHDVYPGGRLRPTEWADVLGVAKEETK